MLAAFLLVLAAAIIVAVYQPLTVWLLKATGVEASATLKLMPVNDPVYANHKPTFSAHTVNIARVKPGAAKPTLIFKAHKIRYEAVPLNPERALRYGNKQKVKIKYAKNNPKRAVIL